MVPGVERTSQGLGAGRAARRGFLKAEAASDGSSRDMCYCTGAPPARGRDGGGADRGRGREMEGTRKWTSGLCSPSEPLPWPSCPRRALPGTGCRPQRWRGSWAPSAQGRRLGWWGVPEGPEEGQGNGRGRGLSAMPPGGRRVKVCSQLPGTQQTSQVPLAHMAQQLSCEPRASGLQAGVSADIPLLRGAQSLRLTAEKGMRVPSQGSAPRAGSSSTPELLR